MDEEVAAEAAAEDVGRAGRAATVVQLVKMQGTLIRLRAEGAGLRGTTATTARPSSATGVVVVDTMLVAAPPQPTNKRILLL